MATADVELMTAEEFLALPDDGTDRWLIRGRLRGDTMTKRNRFHAFAEASVVGLLKKWVWNQPKPRGHVLSGEAGFRLKKNPDTCVGIDVAYISPELAAADPNDTTMIDGAPTLAVEILSPSDKKEEMDEKIAEYLSSGVALVWLVDARWHTVTVHQPGKLPVLYNESQELSADPILKGFQIMVSDIFEE